MKFTSPKFERNKHLHSREHVLADDLARLMLEPKRFAAYLGIARMYHESDLRALAKSVASKPDLDPKNRGKYFFGALKGLQKKIMWFRKIKGERRRDRLKIETKNKHAKKSSRNSAK